VIIRRVLLKADAGLTSNIDRVTGLRKILINRRSPWPAPKTVYGTIPKRKGGLPGRSRNRQPRCHYIEPSAAQGCANVTAFLMLCVVCLACQVDRVTLLAGPFGQGVEVRVKAVSDVTVSIRRLIAGIERSRSAK
jgi:hypothetical protein